MASGVHTSKSYFELHWEIYLFMSIFLSKQNVRTDLVLEIKQDMMFDCRFKSKGWGMSALSV